MKIRVVCRIGFLLCYALVSERSFGMLGDFRLRTSSIGQSAIQAGIEESIALLSWLEFSGAARLQHSFSDLDRFQYSIDLTAFYPLGERSRVGVFGHLHQDNLLSTAASLSSFVGGIHAGIAPSSGSWVLVRFGRVWRSGHVLHATLFPFPFSPDFAEVDLALELRFGARCPWGWTELSLGNLEGLEVYRLNLPYAEAAWSLSETAPLARKIFARWQLLLGFGRPEALVAGFRAAF
jgi:hypothetical protein